MIEKREFDTQSIEALQAQMIAESITRVDAAEKDFSELEGKRTEKIYHVLSDLYKEYHQFKDTVLEEPYFEEVESFLSSKDIPVQSDTSYALMIVKAVFEGKPSVKKGQASKYAKVLQLAKVREVQTDEFFEWVKAEGIEKISRNKAKLPKNEAERSSLERARTLILQWLAVKDAKPVSISDVDIEDMPKSEINSDRFELAICKLRPHPHDKTKAQLHTYWLLPRTEKNEKDYLKDLAWSIMPKLEEFEALVQEGSNEVFGDAVQSELDYAEQKDLALELYLRDCELQNAREHVTGQGMGNAFTKPFAPPKRKK
jgi:hypothetical protein